METERERERETATSRDCLDNEHYDCYNKKKGVKVLDVRFVYYRMCKKCGNIRDSWGNFKQDFPLQKLSLSSY